MNVERKEIDEESDGIFSAYLKYLESLQCIDNRDCPPTPEEDDGADLVTVDMLTGRVLDTFPQMTSFYPAIDVSFCKGLTKEFCIDLSLICSKELCDTTHMTRDTFADGFKLFNTKRNNEHDKAHKTEMNCKRKQQKQNRSATLSHSSKITSPFSSRSSSKSPTENYNVKGNSTADLIIFNKVKSPLAIFECQCKATHAEVQTGVVRLVSHGLSIRNKKQVEHDIKLVLITPSRWYSASLPPYKDGASLNVSFEQFGVFVVEDNADDTETLYLHRKEYLDFLRNLRHHFQLVKSVK